MWIHDVQWRGSVPYGETLHDKYYLFECICIITKRSKVTLMRDYKELKCK